MTREQLTARRPTRVTVASLAMLALGVVTGAVLYAGPLDPPAGPVASSYKTLNEVEPRIAINAVNTPGDADSVFRITAAGSYYLTGNVTGIAGRHGIEIAASNVSIDLMGFSVLGVAGALDGISNVVAAVDNITICNGTVSGWPGDGIQLNSGTNHAVRAVNARSNVGSGIIVDENSIVESCAASANSLDGIIVNGLNGVVRACTATGNLAQGIQLANSGSISDCSSHNNVTGFQTGIGATLVNCSARDNTADGFIVSSACVVSNCSAYSNTNDGFRASSTSTIFSNCTASFNAGDGIEVPGNCTLLGNTCDGNGVGAGSGAGIKVTGTDCRVEGNSLMRNDFGMDVQLTGNLIFRNSAAGNTTNYQIIANNKVGFIVLAPNSAVVGGSTGGAGVGSTDPWANFSY